MRCLIRCDIGAEHGMGHATRCRALAKALASRGAEVVFVTATPALAEFVAPFACDNPVLHNDDVMIVDHKTAYRDSQFNVRRGDNKVVRIDDHTATSHNCDLLVAPCAHWAPETVSRLRADFGPRFLYGWEYVILDDAVTQQVPVPYAERQDGMIVFCAGGSDPGGAIPKMYHWIKDSLPTTKKFFLQGAYIDANYVMWGDIDSTAQFAAFSLEYLRHAALIVGLFGTTCYEALWYRTPMLTLAHTEENDWGSLYLGIQSHHAIMRIGNIDKHHAQSFNTAIQFTWDSISQRQQMHDASDGLLDRHGTARVAEAILAL